MLNPRGNSLDVVGDIVNHLQLRHADKDPIRQPSQTWAGPWVYTEHKYHGRPETIEHMQCPFDG
jgi:hypothetical protein